MRSGTLCAAVVATLTVTPGVARAGITLATSVGSGYRFSESQRVQTNIMVAPGAEILGPLVRAELGLVANMGDVPNHDFDLEVRPMLLFDPPLIPLYARLTVGFARLLDGPLAVAFGGSVGAEVAVKAVSLFGEVGYIPRAGRAGFESVLEGRAGVGFAF